MTGISFSSTQILAFPYHTASANDDAGGNGAAPAMVHNAADLHTAAAPLYKLDLEHLLHRPLGRVRDSGVAGDAGATADLEAIAARAETIEKFDRLGSYGSRVQSQLPRCLAKLHAITSSRMYMGPSGSATEPFHRQRLQERRLWGRRIPRRTSLLADREAGGTSRTCESQFQLSQVDDCRPRPLTI
jgi:hypothetical protein